MLNNLSFHEKLSLVKDGFVSYKSFFNYEIESQIEFDLRLKMNVREYEKRMYEQEMRKLRPVSNRWQNSPRSNNTNQSLR